MVLLPIAMLSGAGMSLACGRQRIDNLQVPSNTAASWVGYTRPQEAPQMTRGTKNLSWKTFSQAVCGSLALMLLVSGCNTAPPLVDTKAAEDAVRAADTAWSKAAVAMDVATVGSYYADDAVVLPPNMPIVHGKDAAQKAWAEMLVPGNSLSWTTSAAVSATSGDIAYTQGTYTASFRGPDGNAVPDTGKYLCIWKKQVDGSWKSVEDTWNSDLPAAAPVAAPVTKKKG
jgi:ketosteroid isomerase-like protein